MAGMPNRRLTSTLMLLTTVIITGPQYLPARRRNQPERF